MGSNLYVKLDASYDDDPKILMAGEKAEVLYLRALCLAKRILSDGFIADVHLPRFGLTSVNVRAKKLVEVGLWERVEGGYLIVSWLKHNSSKDEVEAIKEGGARGNHVRWHVKERKPSSSCEFCVSDGIAPASGGDSPTESGGESGGRIPEAEAEAEAEATTTSAVADPEVSQQARNLTRQFAIAVKANGFKVPSEGQKNRAKWLEDMDRLLRLGAPGGEPDPQDPAEVAKVIDWTTRDEFWSANIGAPAKFREQYPKLRLKMLNQTPALGKLGTGGVAS